MPSLTDRKAGASSLAARCDPSLLGIKHFPFSIFCLEFFSWCLGSWHGVNVHLLMLSQLHK